MLNPFEKDSEKILLNWNEKINWENPDDETKEALFMLYLPEDEQLYRRKEIDSRKLNYTYVKEGTKIILNIYPDTLCWLNDFPYGYMEIFTNT